MKAQKAISILFIIGLFLLFGCPSKVMGQGELKAVNDGLQLLEKGWLHYKVNSETPFSGLAVAKYENGQKKAEKTYKDGKLDGVSTTWYENGQKKSEETYKDGKLNGVWTTWYENGEKIEETLYKDGVWTDFYENGQKKHERAYKNGILEGVHTLWYENGQKKMEVHFKDGKLDGVQTFWLENGSKYSETLYNDGKEIFSRTHQIITKKEETPSPNKEETPGKYLVQASNLMLGGMVVTAGGAALSLFVFEDNQKVIGYGVTIVGGFMGIYGIAMIGKAGRIMEKKVTKNMSISPLMDNEGIGICLKF